jgi:hypothetical protein
MHVDFFVIFGQMRGNLINVHTQSQGVMGQCTVNLLSLVLGPTDFLTDRS